MLDDIGGGIESQKCKGHVTEADVLAGRSTAFLRTDNGQADHFAACGAAIAEHLPPAEDCRAAYRETRK